MRVCVVGGGAALAQLLISHWLNKNHSVTALCRNTLPVKYSDPKVNVIHSLAYVDYNPYDLLVTLAGSAVDHKIGPNAESAWSIVLENTLTSVYEALANIPIKDGGNVVVVGSIVGSTGAYGAANYAAAKAGLVGLVRSAALEWAARGVCVNLLELGFMDVGMGARLPEKVKARVLPTIPLGRFGTAEDFVHAVEFLSTTRWMTGNVLTLAGGMR